METDNDWQQIDEIKNKSLTKKNKKHSGNLRLGGDKKMTERALDTPMRPSHRKNRSSSSSRLFSLARKYKNHEITKEEYLEMIKGEMRFTIIKLTEEYRSDEYSTESQEHVDERLYPMIVAHAKKCLQIKGDLDLRIQHSIQSIIYAYLDKCETGSVDIDHNIETYLQPRLLEFSSNLYLDAGVDLLEWDSQDSMEEASPSPNVAEQKHTFTSRLSTIKSASNVLIGKEENSDNKFIDGEYTLPDRSPHSVLTRSGGSYSIDDTFNCKKTDQHLLDLIPPGKLEIEIQDCTFTQQNSIFEFRRPSIYVKANCLWTDEEKCEFRTSALPFVAKNKPLVWSSSVSQGNISNGDVALKNIKTFNFPGGKHVKHEPRLSIYICAERSKS